MTIVLVLIQGNRGNVFSTLQCKRLSCSAGTSVRQYSTIGKCYTHIVYTAAASDSKCFRRTAGDYGFKIVERCAMRSAKQIAHTESRLQRIGKIKGKRQMVRQLLSACIYIRVQQ